MAKSPGGTVAFSVLEDLLSFNAQNRTPSNLQSVRGTPTETPRPELCLRSTAETPRPCSYPTRSIPPNFTSGSSALVSRPGSARSWDNQSSMQETIQELVNFTHEIRFSITDLEARMKKDIAALQNEFDCKFKSELNRAGYSSKSFLDQSQMSVAPIGNMRGVTNITADSACVNIGLDAAEVEGRLDCLERRLHEVLEFSEINVTGHHTDRSHKLTAHPTELSTEVVQVAEADLSRISTEPTRQASTPSKSIRDMEKAHQDLKSQMMSLSHLPAMLEERLDIKTNQMTEHAKRKSGLDEFDFELDCSYDRPLDQSVWDGLFFFGLPSMGIVHTLFIFFGFMATVFTQGVFCASILKGGTSSSAFLADQYPDMDEIKTWRIHSGHNIKMIDDLGGFTLVNRVCKSDQSVPYSGVYQTLHADTVSYLSDDVGVYLCSAALFVWALTIIQSFNPVLSGICSALMMKHGKSTMIGKATLSGYNFRIITFTWHRTFALIMLQLVRGGVVLITGITGALWLANTKNLANLILNASALSLILSVDQLAYFVFLPKKLQCLIESAQPLQLPDKFFGGVIHTSSNILLMAVFTLLVLFLNVLPDHKLLKDKHEALCGGNLDFVYTRHAPTDTLYAASTLGFRGAESKEYVTSLTAMMAAGQRGNLTSNSIAITPNAGKVTLVHSENLQSYVEAYMSYNPFCADSNKQNFQSYTLQKRSGTSSTATCADWKDWCGKPDSGLFRLLCPITCGCADPISGLMYRVRSEGCAVETCSQTVQYVNRLHQLPCEDYSPSELQLSAEWKLYFDHLVRYEWMHLQQQVNEVRHYMLQDGCQGILRAHSGVLQFNFCLPTEASAHRPGMASLRAFCPITCGCHTLESKQWLAHDCPTSCFNITAANATPNVIAGSR